METKTEKRTKSLSGFFGNYSSNPKLHKKAWKQGGVEWEDYKSCPSDYYAANTGSVPGMIYYHDTVKFGKRNADIIHEAMHDFESECGIIENMPRLSDDETQYYNWLAWFAWENMAGELQNYLEEE